MRNLFRPTGSSLLLLVMLVLLQPGHASASQAALEPPLPEPSVELPPGAVVEIIIEALANNNYPFQDAGIETTFNFASPVNKQNTGPLERFVKLVKGPVFGKMVNHRDSTLSQVILEGDKALRLVQIVGVNNETLYFAFRLGLQQQGEQAGMWLTEAVWPLESPADDVLAL